jgi:hypothetical protein
MSEFASQICPRPCINMTFAGCTCKAELELPYFIFKLVESMFTIKTSMQIFAALLETDFHFGFLLTLGLTIKYAFELIKDQLPVCLHDTNIFCVLFHPHHLCSFLSLLIFLVLLILDFFFAALATKSVSSRSLIASMSSLSLSSDGDIAN